MEKKLTKKDYVFLASMLFGLFFGAGNLIFPVSMGQQSGSAMWPAVIGFCLTGVGLPLFGITAMGISKSEGLLDMSSKVSRGFGYFFTCTLYLCIGPLFAIPRTATVSFSVGVLPMISDKYQTVALFVFTLLFFAAVLFFSLRPSGILTWVGKVLNPIFLVLLGILMIMALIHPMSQVSASAPVAGYADQSFFTGFLEGYNTMDALASLAFGIILINVIRGLGVKDPKQISLGTMKAGFFSTLIMAVIYCSLTVVGAQSRAVYGISADGGVALNAIATHYFGNFGGILLGIMITLACLKTSIGLVTSCSTTFTELFPKKCSYKVYAILFTLFSFAIGNVGLSRIITYSLPVLMFLYPLTIALILLCLFGRLFHYRRCVFQCTMITTGCAAFLDFFNALPDAVHNVLPFSGAVKKVAMMLPFADIGMGWIVPCVIGLVIGLVIMVIRRDNGENNQVNA